MGNEKQGDPRIAPCGNYCGGCNDYLVRKSDDLERKKKVASDISEQLGIKLSPEEAGCEGCWGGIHEVWAANPACAVRRCVDGKGFSSCADCVDFPCHDYTGLFPEDSDPFINIIQIRERGADGFLSAQSSLEQA
ncbi:MAG: DUF3795 domain-containing protein [Planctomycetes bacterium]|nr:DUF3795 domain-containing protein [Planctomycetota bacterium]